MKRIIAASLMAISSMAFAQVSADKIFLGETDSNEAVYMIAPSIQIKRTNRGNFYINGDAEVTNRSTGKSIYWTVGAPLQTCAAGRGLTVISNMTAVAMGVPAEQAIEQFYWEKHGTKQQMQSLLFFVLLQKRWLLSI